MHAHLKLWLPLRSLSHNGASRSNRCVCVCVVWDVEGYLVNKQKGDSVCLLTITLLSVIMVLQVLAEGSQMRKEADDTGPLAELEYWKQRTAKFSCLVDQIKSQPCKGVITTLVAAKSKVIKVREE